MEREEVQYKQNCTGSEFVKNVLEARKAMFEKSLYENPIEIHKTYESNDLNATVGAIS
jgi:hypothetical protein